MPVIFNALFVFIFQKTEGIIRTDTNSSNSNLFSIYFVYINFLYEFCFKKLLVFLNSWQKYTIHGMYTTTDTNTQHLQLPRTTQLAAFRIPLDKKYYKDELNNKMSSRIQQIQQNNSQQTPERERERVRGEGREKQAGRQRVRLNCPFFESVVQHDK